MEARLEKYRKEKKKELHKVNNERIATIKTKKSSSLINLMQRWQQHLLSTKIFIALSVKLSNIPFLGWPLLLWTVLWLILFGLAVELEFGIVYCIVSTFVFLYVGTSTKKRKSTEKSAYSVFNDNCERLQGTFTAEDFDKQLRRGKI